MAGLLGEERSIQPLVRGDPLVLQRKGPDQDLVAPCQSDIFDSSSISPKDRRVDLVFRLRANRFVKVAAKDGKLALVKKVRWL